IFALPWLCGCSRTDPNASNAPKSELVKGPQALAKMKVKKITIHQVDPKSELTDVSQPREGYLQSWKIVQSKTIDSEQDKTRIIKTLLKLKYYQRAGAKCFDPGMALSLSDENSTIDVIA